MTFAVLMTTFYVSFTIIENLLPTLYRQGFLNEIDGIFERLVIELEREIRGITRGEDGEIYGESLFIDWSQIFLDWNWHTENIIDRREDVHVVQFYQVQQIVDHFALYYNMSITIWRIEPFTAWKGPMVYHLDGRGTGTALPGSHIFTHSSGEYTVGFGQFNSYHLDTGGFALNVEGTFQPALRMLGIISDLQTQILIVMIFISIVISTLYSLYLARPIVRLSHESKKLRNLEFDENVQIKRRDEIGDLSSNLNYMSRQLRTTLDDLQEANEKLKEEMEREREQERQRRNLFTSISHELKTPITILKGEIGGMIDKVGAYKDRDSYLESVYGWTESLEKLVSEILTVTRLEGEKMRLNLTQTDISALLTEICHTHQSLADNQNVLLNQFLDSDLIVKADEAQLQIAISNVINNAVFYTKPDELVKVQLKQEGGFATLTVTNTGAHIAEADLRNLFAPFYRIDRSRNRHTGGSGLGLFIVKNILELHDFEYEIENIEEGVRFTIKMPLS